MAVRDQVPAVLEIDGADVHPHTVDPRLAADLISTFFKLLTRAARVRGVPFTLRGIRIEDKCFQLGCDAPDPEFAIQAMDVLSSWVSGKEVPDTRADRELTKHFNSVVRQFSEDATAKLAVGSWVRPLEFSDTLPELPPQVTSTLRVKVTDVGVDPARVRFESGSENDPFSIEVTTEQAETLGHYVNQEIDLTFRYRRNRQGRIEDGQLIAFFPMEVDDNGENWLMWLSESGRQWDEVGDHLEELGRRGD